MVISSKKLRQSAKGEQCTINVQGVCTYDPETVVLCHFPSDIAGYKATDLSSGYGCAACHDWIDRRVSAGPEEDADREFYMRRSQIRTHTKFYEKGLIQVK